ncbi:adhesin [Streptomyces liangshanensis]|uniref:Adhesin n=1 Tax=Streptomyces liangshanensis TaxID=2717324 RepID=A0A6G9H186_9ACTN|nr:adhesin [Streptomyces liangshanensis]QIQ04293.1 adhesin [Streptomyces liangshanensis]
MRPEHPEHPSRVPLRAALAVLVLGAVAAVVFAVTGRDTANTTTDEGAPSTAPTDVQRPQLPALRGAVAPTPPPNTGYSVWAGPGCGTGRYEEAGRFENGDAAWYTVKSGGHQDDACDGSFSAMPMSGSANDDRGSTATWSWELGRGYETCALAVYVPDSGNDLDAAGDPSVYEVLSDASDPHSGYAAFGVRQPAHRGTLVKVGNYRVKGTDFTVRLRDRGQDWGTPTRIGAHHAAAQMHLTCT